MYKYINIEIFLQSDTVFDKRKYLLIVSSLVDLALAVAATVSLYFPGLRERTDRCCRK